MGVVGVGGDAEDILRWNCCCCCCWLWLLPKPPRLQPSRSTRSSSSSKTPLPPVLPTTLYANLPSGGDLGVVVVVAVGAAAVVETAVGGCTCRCTPPAPANLPPAVAGLLFPDVTDKGINLPPAVVVVAAAVEDPSSLHNSMTDNRLLAGLESTPVAGLTPAADDVVVVVDAKPFVPLPPPSPSSPRPWAVLGVGGGLPALDRPHPPPPPLEALLSYPYPPLPGPYPYPSYPSRLYPSSPPYPSPPSLGP